MAAKYSPEMLPTETPAIPFKFAKPFKDVWDKLMELSCPLIITSKSSHSHDKWLSFEPFLKPGEARIKLLQWIFYSIDEELSSLVNKPAMNIELKTTGILEITKNLKLVTEKEADLIRGNAPVIRQLNFFNYLLSLAVARRRVDEENARDLSRSDLASQFSDATCLFDSCTLSRNYNRHSQFIDSIAFKRLPLVFNKPVLSVPAEIIADLERRGIRQPHQRRISPTKHVDMITTKLNGLEMELKHHRDFTTSTMEIENYDESEMRQSLMNLMLIARDITREIERFDDIFKAQVESCSQNSNSAFSPIGASMAKMEDLMEEIEQFFAAAHSLKESSKNFDSSLTESIDAVVSQGIGMIKLKQLDEWILILRKSIENYNSDKRRCDSSTSTSNNTSIQIKKSPCKKNISSVTHYVAKKNIFDNCSTTASGRNNISPTTSNSAPSDLDAFLSLQAEMLK